MFRLVTRSLSYRPATVIRAATAVARPVTPLATRFISQSAIRFNLSQDASMLTKEDVLARSVQVLKGFDVKTQDITMDSKFQQDLGFDSLDANDALVALEEEFDVVFDDKFANEVKTVGEAVDYVLANYIPPQQTLDRALR
ncbi:hypothetical protein PACTADRAFT_50659 [Pachysolen tannophilus NRRL Y-2460]|uniref:Acyl carrier protein n=1 Tax=Pachysolen tannophilus NRRL Y-2460 TaxID=669874 RepID=A0A1E4TSS4_PACTA|nr:hypothetical protein PACTADRAFT_50659 [Pachysolen tannophilus NRRL Y-2460]